MKTTYQVRVVKGSVLELTGVGEEWLLDPVTDELMAKFWNGNFMSLSNSLSQQAGFKDEPTLLIAA